MNQTAFPSDAVILKLNKAADLRAVWVKLDDLATEADQTAANLAGSVYASNDQKKLAKGRAQRAAAKAKKAWAAYQAAK